MNNLSEEPFYQMYRGSFTGLRRWQDLEEFWQILRNKADQDWYVYAIGEALPENPLSGEKLGEFIDEIDVLLRKEHGEEYCGIVYVDNRTDPSFIKIYDPNNLGVTCGFSQNPPLPGWIICQLKPQELSQKSFLPQNRRRWWQNLFSK